MALMDFAAIAEFLQNFELILNEHTRGESHASLNLFDIIVYEHYVVSCLDLGLVLRDLALAILSTLTT